MSPTEDRKQVEEKTSPAGNMATADIDPEIKAIFVEEAREVISSLQELYSSWIQDEKNKDIQTDLRRAFHTLKGSGRMVSAEAIGELAWRVEDMLNEVIGGRIEPEETLLTVVADIIKFIPSMVAAYESGKPEYDSEKEAYLRELASRLASGEKVVLATASDGADASGAEAGDGYDPDLMAIFVAEVHHHLAVVEEFLIDQRQKAPFYDKPSQPLQAALHTLKGSAHMADVQPMARLTSPLEKLVKELLSYQVTFTEDCVELLANCSDYCRRVVASLEASEVVDTSDLENLIARIEEMRDIMLEPVGGQESGPTTVDPAFLNLLMADGMQKILDAESTLVSWQTDPGFQVTRINELMEELTELGAGAAKAGYPPLAELSGVLAGSYGRLVAETGAPAAGDIGVLLEAHEKLLNIIDAIASHQEIVPVEATFLGELAQLYTLAAGQTPQLSDSIQTDSGPTQEAAEIDEHREEESFPEKPELSDDVEREVVELFLAEADELLEELENTLEQWALSPEDHRHADIVKRNLHTFKGGARMAGLIDLGEECHNLETFVISSEVKVLRGASEPIEEIEARLDDLGTSLEAVRRALSQQVSQPEASEQTPAPAQPVWQTAEILPFTGTYKGLYPQKQLTSPESQQTSQEAVRISAPLLDLLVNLAGETSISRAQVEQNINEFIFSLDEMEATIGRMLDQVRRLGIETDAQVMFRREQIEASDSVDGFDPLEMDRYSQLQQLSRSLLESASDLQDLRYTLLDKSRDAEALLLQQSRINTDLQEGLMRTRMVPFSRIVPRLRRVVRQVGNALGKQVKLQLGNVEGELDRSVLERIIAPLEHMLRNAIDHGIEPEDARAELGKNSEGTISLNFARDGGDILIRMADDGRGLDIDAIRDKAFSLGLLNENYDYSESEIAQFIFHPGFSTAQEVTQTSGRGVGMDVVDSEVRQLGGAVMLSTQKGAGTEFTIRLPFTVSVNRAFMIQIGDDSYALALNSISGVTRMSVDQLDHFYNNPREKFSYGGELYEVRYLGTLLSGDLRPSLTMSRGQLPVVLIRVDDKNYAVQVDALIGSREIVVKSLGTQFSRVPGLSGATILGDGRVVVILDLHGLLRDQSAATVLPPLQTEPDSEIRDTRKVESNVQTIMVVDDSVTVRKVTSRFLEREGFRVVTARDGVDAMRALQELTPDLMLLDIEMPRMDGFEVARLVRSTDRLKDMPIIMITSRTGEKHRERALAMGVNQYLGKPYQEDVLIEEVYGLLTRAETG